MDASDTNYVELEARTGAKPSSPPEAAVENGDNKKPNTRYHMSRRREAEQEEEEEEAEGRMVNVVLSDMSAPWEQTTGFYKRSLSNPYYRMMNTSGMSFRDHAGSMVGHIINFLCEGAGLQ